MPAARDAALFGWLRTLIDDHRPLTAGPRDLRARAEKAVARRAS